MSNSGRVIVATVLESAQSVLINLSDERYQCEGMLRSIHIRILANGKTEALSQLKLPNAIYIYI